MQELENVDFENKIKYSYLGSCILMCFRNLVKYSIDHIQGADSHRELHVRLFFRRVFIDQARNMEEKAFWLDLILKSLPMVHQAKVLFLLFGPVATGTFAKNIAVKYTNSRVLEIYNLFLLLANFYNV